MTELTARIDYALTAPEPDEAVERIKVAVAEELRRLDPALDEIALLDDFNHSYRPDLVLRWGSGRGKRERPVYLRFVAAGLAARLDLATLSSRRPLFLGLLHHHLKSDDPAIAGEAEAVAEAALGTSLVSDVSALDQLDPGQDQQVPTMATSALVRAGSGSLGPVEAKALRAAVSGGYAAALAGGDPEAVDLAAEALSSFLSEPDTERVDLQLDLLWLASGGKLDDLDDGDRLLRAELKPDEWSLLLDQFLSRREKSDEQLWEMLGARMGLDDAATAVAKIPEHRHLQAFVSANTKQWRARYAGVINHPDSEMKGWWISDNTLALGRGHTSIAITSSKKKFNRTGSELARRSFDELKRVMRRDQLVSLDARADTTSIRLSGDEVLPTDRVAQVVKWTSEIQGLTVEATIDKQPVKLTISYVTGRIETSRDIPLGDLQRRAVRYFEVPPATAPRLTAD